MQYNLNINVVKAAEWGLDSRLACLFSYLFTVKLWAEPKIIDGQNWYWIAKSKIIQEVPILGDKPDTIYRQMKELQEKGLLVINKNKGLKRTYIQITQKALEWHHEIDPVAVTNSNDIGKKSDVTSEKNPKDIGKKSDGSVNQLSIYQEDQKTHVPSDDDTSVQQENKSGYSDEFEQAWKEYPKRTGANNKKAAFKAWNARLKAGATAEQMISGVRAYSKFIDADRTIDRRYVMMASTFFGPREEYNEYSEDMISKQPVRVQTDHGLNDKDYSKGREF